MTTLSNYIFLGLLKSFKTSSIYECKHECQETEECKGFNWNKPTCQLVGGHLIRSGERLGNIAAILPCAP